MRLFQTTITQFSYLGQISNKYLSENQLFYDQKLLIVVKVLKL